MLSRVAESLYWMARHIERAEAVARLAAVDFQALLDGTRRGRLEDVVRITSESALFRRHFPAGDEAGVLEFLHAHPANPSGVLVCLSRARENARGMREQISSEMWEHANQLYFMARDVDRPAVLRSPHQFFQQVRDGSQAFQGVTMATMTHDEPFEFIRLGTHLERADKTVRLLEARYLEVSRLPAGSPETALQLIALLRSCSAFWPFRRAAGLSLQTDKVVEYLLLSRDFPRAVLFCVNRCRQSAALVGDPAGQSRPDHPHRSLGRLSADLEYLNLPEVLGGQMAPYLGQLLQKLNGVSADIARTYFNTRVVLADERPRQQQQQQQQ